MLREPGEGPQLLIYPLRAKQLSKAELDKLAEQGRTACVTKDPLVSLVFGLPSTGSDKDNVWIDYDVNAVYRMQKELGFSDGDEP